MKKTLIELNALSQAEFVQLLGGVYEHSPWVAERSWAARPFADHESLLTALRQTLDQAKPAEQLALIRAHPDLAGKAALAGELTTASTREQASAGLDHCSPEELSRFHELNAAYQARFGFPFIMAVKNATRQQILAGFETRLEHSIEQEFTTALAQINRIAAFRVQDLIH
ncbi:2-oxo-4-hydroxy-4-carboxy-5-ureidoimidazoline decarboxylase [Thiothrix eikelboomii]|uniref:2-oxo-4-hydroxy-4-carboxy-5-ureidoimidazoline decarboxylase n=1 Tax=Thiothrix eikelboomii TaxID=92487 RepID=A0A1T4X0X3_9GAMM|nr:2-oxo-4-hydroxy-4-carboxy-5-ureidoimidazoline decarboxylase [Thiothrix eikelboomii]SKA83240.1 2-oxo-4-hydroxy-4-carboxy-5-ureidoimidazoline decarboxylase [Thiothrix eikelboomii]